MQTWQPYLQERLSVLAATCAYLLTKVASIAR